MAVIPQGALCTHGSFCCGSFLRSTREHLRMCWRFLGWFRQFLIPCYPRSYCEARPHSAAGKIAIKPQSKTFENGLLRGFLFCFLKTGWSVCSFYPPLPILLPQPQKVKKWKICKSPVTNQGKVICISSEPKDCLPPFSGASPQKRKFSSPFINSTFILYGNGGINWGVGRE